MSLFMLAAPMSPIAVLAGFIAGGAVGAGAYRAALRKHFFAQPVDVDTRMAESAAQRLRAGLNTEHRPAFAWLPPPSSVVQPSENSEQALDRVTPFIDRLFELRRSEWLAIGRVVLKGRNDGRASRSTSRAILDATIAHRRLETAAWYVRDSIETVGFLARHSAPPLPRSHRRILAAAQVAAEEASLAVLVRECLPAADFQMMCAPFAESGDASWRGTFDGSR